VITNKSGAEEAMNLMFKRIRKRKRKEKADNLHNYWVKNEKNKILLE